MAPIVGTPRRASAGRSRKAASAQPKSAGSKRAGSPTPTAPTTEKRKRRYVPGGPGGGGRYIDEEGNEEPVGGTGPGGYNYVGPRGRIGQENARKGITPVVYQRRDRSTRTRTVMPRSQQPAMRFSSAAQAAAAVVQNDGYKPREERSWEEFHPNLDIDAKLMVFSADEVDGVVKTQPTTPAGPLSTNGSTADLSVADTPSRNGAHTPVVDGNGDLAKLGSLPGTPPAKRRPGRPPRDPVAFYAARAVKAGLILTPGAPKTPRIAPLQNQNAKERLTLLQPSYRKVDALAKFEDKTSKYWQAHYVEKSMVNVGYQQTDKFIRPEGTLIQASDLHQEEDLDMSAKSGNDSHIVPVGGSVGRVEYDMDEQDDKWLEAYNAERKSQVIEPITREMFEITITKIEKEWHALEKRMPKPNPKPPQTHRPRSSSAAAVNGEPQDGEEQDSKCAICDDGDCENTNAIVFCDGCDLAVHQECYGVPFIPEGQWLCRKCQLLGRGIPTCIFCPNIDGGFKQTNSSRWAHLLCAMWIPEVSLGNHTFMEPVMDVEKVPKNRWKLSCYICQQKMGACIQCGNKQCFQAFHVTCARRARLFLKMKNSHGALAELDNSTVLKAFCDKHCPLDYARDNDVSRATKEAKAWYRKTMKGRLWADSQATAVAMRADQQHAHSQNLRTDSQIGAIGHWTSAGDIKKKEAAQPTKPVWKLPSGAPVIPALVYDLVEGSLQRFNIRKRRDWVATACRYWTLKREARRGAALLKRLQLQMETFTSNELARRDFVNMKQGRAKLQRRIDFAKILIADLERLRDLSHAVVERETQKLEFALNHQATVDTIYFPIAKLLPTIVEKALTLDGKNIFASGLMDIYKRLQSRERVLATALAQDLGLVFKKGVETLPIIKPEEDTSVTTTATKQAIHELKERKKLAKRIIKAIQPQLEVAVHAEADLTQQSGDKMIQDLERLFETCVAATPESVIEGSQYTINEQEPTGMDVDPKDDEEAEVDESKGTCSLDTYTGIKINPREAAALEQAVQEEMNDADEVVPISTTSNDVSQDEEQEVDDTSTELKPNLPLNGIKSQTPPETNGYAEPPQHQQPQPPTPPISNVGAASTISQDPNTDTTSFLTEGGRPWYLKDYDPVSSTFAEPEIAAPETVRSVTDELSEIDDDELNDLGVDTEMGEALDVREVDGKPAAAVERTKKGKVKRRWKGYK